MSKSRLRGGLIRLITNSISDATTCVTVPQSASNPLVPAKAAADTLCVGTELREMRWRSRNAPVAAGLDLGFHGRCMEVCAQRPSRPLKPSACVLYLAVSPSTNRESLPRLTIMYSNAPMSLVAAT